MSGVRSGRPTHHPPGLPLGRRNLSLADFPDEVERSCSVTGPVQSHVGTAAPTRGVSGTAAIARECAAERLFVEVPRVVVRGEERRGELPDLSDSSCEARWRA